MSAETTVASSDGHRPPLQSGDRARYVRDQLPAGGLFAGQSWRIAPEAFPLPADLAAKLEALGGQLLAFYRACNTLYRHSLAGKQPRWIAEYLDAGKPERLLEISRCDRIKSHIPHVIRPDVILNDEHFFITELDSVPGGIGLTGWLGKTYSKLGDNIIGGGTGMMEGFAAAMQMERHPLTVVVSEESATYRPEMEWLGQQCGFAVVRPEEVQLGGTGGSPVRSNTMDRRAACPTIYRFFELFDLPNIANGYEMLAGNVTPPPKPQLEEKALLALLWMEQLRPFWREQLGDKTLAEMREIFPHTWIVDPTPLPPHAVVAGLDINDWREMAKFSQKQRELVLKISGFHEHAWGSRGVYVGHDLSAKDWAKAIELALANFPQHPFILQRFEKSKLVDALYFDFEANEVRTFSGRVRLCPYYFVVGDTAKLGGILATICPADKKLLHGMPDAVMAPCCVRP